MADNLMAKCTEMGTKLVLAASLAASFTGCASTQTNASAPAQPLNATAKCTSPTAASTTSVLAAAALGHLIDKSTGGGRGAEQFAGKLADQVQHGCPAPAPVAASGPK